MSSRREAAIECLDALDGPFLKAVSEPARIAILRVLILHGQLDVGSIAELLPQDRSVIARHLQVLERARLLRSSQEGRHTRYELNGEGLLKQLETLLELFKRLAPICCPK